MSTIATILSWKPDDLANAATQLNSDRKTLLDLQDEIDAAEPPADWTGDDATTARTSHTRLKNRLNDMVAPLSEVIEGLDTASAKIKTAQDTITSYKDNITTNGWTLEESGGSITVSDPTPPGVLLEPIQDVLLMSVAQGLADAVGDADQADADLQAILTSAKNGEYDGGTGTLADAALPEELRALSDDELIEHLLANPEEFDSYTSALTTEQRQALGEELADRADDYAIDDPYTDGTEVPSDEDLATLAEQMEAFGSDSTVATSFLNSMGPENFLKMQQTMLSVGYGDDNALEQYYSPETLQATQNALGNLLAHGTNGTTAGSNGSDTAVSDDYIQDLIALGEQNHQVNPYGNAYNGYQLLGPLLRDDDHGSYFLNTMGDNMERFEREFTEENGRSPWEPSMGGPDFIDYTQGDPDGTHPFGDDPFDGLFDGMSKNPDAARDFFTGGDGDRVGFYTTEREYAPYYNYDGQDQYPTARGSLGEALLSATTQDPDERSPDLAEEIIAQTSGEGHDLHPELKDSMGRMMAAYMPDVYGTFHDGDNNFTEFTGHEQDPDLRANFEIDDLRNFLKEIGEDEGAGAHVSAAATQYSSLGYDAYFNGTMDEGDVDLNDPATWDTRANRADTHVTEPWADITGALGKGYHEQFLADVAAEDAQTSSEGDWVWNTAGTLLDEGVSNTAGKIPFVGFIAEDAVNAPIDAFIDDRLAANDVDRSEETRQEIGSQITDERINASAVAENAVYRNLPDDILRNSGNGAGSVFFDGDGNRIPMSQWNQEQIEAWQSINDGNGPAGAAGTLGNNVEDRFSTGAREADEADGDG